MKAWFLANALKLAAGVAILSMAFGVVQTVRLDLSQSAHKATKAELQGARLQIAVIEADAERRSEAAREALERARAENARNSRHIAPLRASAATPRPPSPECTISDALKAAEGAL